MSRSTRRSSTPSATTSQATGCQQRGIDRFPASPDLQSSVTRVDIVGNAASVRLDLDNVAGHRFTDFLNLLKINGQWAVVSKVFYLHPGLDGPTGA
ncbi:nuclear transport factor 2 family protein [Pseudomonas chlororaphis]|uniref:nuclear transport factor 2 family protein n=1 Tax=Pseudomonas chlororaphis TaxID=587753 RepID=UPI0029589092|nr:nuclear transport factor 2 family protein [Pseudomonas chlororaphis]